MNGNALVRILATFGLLIASLWVAFDIFTSGSNAVARFYMYTMVTAGIYGLLNARRAFFLLLFLTGYLDFFKRFMIFDSALSRMDLYYVLGIAPACLAGIVGNILYMHFTGKVGSRPGLNKVIILTLAGTGAALFLSLSGGASGFRSIGDSVNATAYISLLFVVPVLFRTPDELRRLLKALVILYVPAIAYMLVHYFRGAIFDWEMAYLKSGLTIEIRQLSERVFRPFGTMNAAGNASVAFGCIAAVCLSGMWSRPGSNGRSMFFGFRFFILPAAAIAMYATYSRTGWVLGAVAILAAPMIKNRSFTLGGYILAITAFLSVVAASPYLLKHQILNELSSDMFEEKRTDEWAQTTNISTLNDRLSGFAFLMEEPRVWTPFGMKLSGANASQVLGNAKVHDLITEMLVKYGYITLLFAGIFMLRQLWKLHSTIFNEPEPLAKALGASSLAIGLSVTSGATVNGSQFETYPTNFFIWFFFAITTSLAMYARERSLAQAPATAAEPPPWMKSQVRVAPSRTSLPVPAQARG